jgi:hypothetical protein
MQVFFKQIWDNVKSVILEPKQFWKRQSEGGLAGKHLFTRYLLPLVVLASVAVLAGEIMRGSRFYVLFPAMKGLREMVLFLLQYVISVFLTNHLIKAFGGEKNIQAVRKLVVFSLTPFLLASVITGLFPFLYVFDALGLYGFYILWIGVQELLTFPERKESGFCLVAILGNFFVFSFLSIFLSKLLSAFL